MPSASLPVRECGLKFHKLGRFAVIPEVTPCAGVWIEIAQLVKISSIKAGHSLCGSVD